MCDFVLLQLLRNRRALEHIHDLESERRDKLEEVLVTATTQAKEIEIKYEEVCISACFILTLLTSLCRDYDFIVLCLNILIYFVYILKLSSFVAQVLSDMDVTFIM